MCLCVAKEMNGKPYLLHLNSFEDLQTSYEQVRAGFVSLALEKNRQATPYVEEARTLKALAGQATNPNDLLNHPAIRSALLTAAGISEKAAKHLNADDKVEAIAGLIANFLDPAGELFVEELVFRYLLVRGDALGGLMRNIGGVLAERKLSRVILATLALNNIPAFGLHAGTQWTAIPEQNADFEISLKGLSWESPKGPRTLLHNINVPVVKKNIDLCLFASGPYDVNIRDANSYVALGELKGGIDPAGSDEHWKTARSALERIRVSFDDPKPAIFFIGAAVEKAMSVELWDFLESGHIHNASNLTNPNQLASICSWIVNL